MCPHFRWVRALCWPSEWPLRCVSSLPLPPPPPPPTQSAVSKPLQLLAKKTFQRGDGRPRVILSWHEDERPMLICRWIRLCFGDFVLGLAIFQCRFPLWTLNDSQSIPGWFEFDLYCVYRLISLSTAISMSVSCTCSGIQWFESAFGVSSLGFFVLFSLRKRASLGRACPENPF